MNKDVIKRYHSTKTKADMPGFMLMMIQDVLKATRPGKMVKILLEYEEFFQLKIGKHQNG